ncbi:MAG: carboxypeptidase regulatory-like domain-containing protein [Candidatus Bathyarchaeia archaeon]
MKEKLSKKIVGLLIAATLLVTFMPNIVYASSGLTLEKNQEWLTGDDSYSLANAAGDIDEDGVTEIVTAGYFYNSTTGIYLGEVNVWNWNGTHIIEEWKEIVDPSYTWSTDTRFYAVALGNVDNETGVEIVAAGYGKFLNFIEQGLLVVLIWNGTSMERKTGWYWPFEANETKFFDVTIGDVDRDNTTEIIAVGYRNTTSLYGTGFHGAITIWNITDAKLTLETSQEWLIGGGTEGHSVAVDDVDEDGDIEIIVTGYFYDDILGHDCAMLRICTWNGSIFIWEASTKWYTYLETYSVDVAIGDLDSDGRKEIVTIGRQFNGENYYAQLRIWSWDGTLLTLKLSVEGGLVGPFTSTSGKAVAIHDVDKDGKKEIIAGLDVAILFGSTPIITIFSWNGNTLTTKDAANWREASNIEDVTCADVDADGNIEVLTAGYKWQFMVVTEKSELAIWSVSKVASALTVNVSPSSIVIGSQVTISGRLTNEAGDTPIPNAEVTIEFSREPLPVLVTIGKVITNENGEYTFTWIPQAAGNYMIRVSWKGDYEHEAAAATTPLTVEKASSMITLTLSSYTATVGDSISVSGTLYPAKPAAITLKYTKPDSSISTKTVYSNQAGVFTDTFTADQAGQWQITASWSGDDTYKAAESAPAPLTVIKIQSTLSITASQLTVNLGENITINGALTPGQAANITLTYTMPNGTITTKTVPSNTTGAFIDTIRLDKAGTWQVKAKWTGDAQHTAAESTLITLTAQAVDTTTPMFALGGLGLGIIALILAAIALLMSSRKPKAAPPTQPSQ